MMIELCTCDRYPVPHDHARATTMIEGTWVTHITYPDSTRANVGDVVRCVDWKREGGRLANVVHSFITNQNQSLVRDALERWSEVMLTADHAVPGV